MTDEHAPDSASRRARLATRRSACASSVSRSSSHCSSSASAPRRRCAATTPCRQVRARHAAGTNLGPATAPNLGVASKLKPPRVEPRRPAEAVDRRRLAGRFVRPRARPDGRRDRRRRRDHRLQGLERSRRPRASATGTSTRSRRWPTENPDAVVFIIGTNDASIVNSLGLEQRRPPDWEVDYRAKIDRMMETFVGGARHRTVFWLGPPTLGDNNLDKGAKGLGPVMREEAKKFAPDVVYVDTYRLFSDSNGEYSRCAARRDTARSWTCASPTACTSRSTAQSTSPTSFGSCSTSAGTSRKQADPFAADRSTRSLRGSNDYVPGVGHYRPKVSYSSPSTTPASSVTATTGVDSVAHDHTGHDHAHDPAHEAAGNHPAHEATRHHAPDSTAGPTTAADVSPHVRRRPLRPGVDSGCVS